MGFEPCGAAGRDGSGLASPATHPFSRRSKTCGFLLAYLAVQKCPCERCWYTRKDGDRIFKGIQESFGGGEGGDAMKKARVTIA